MEIAEKIQAIRKQYADTPNAAKIINACMTVFLNEVNAVIDEIKATKAAKNKKPST